MIPAYVKKYPKMFEPLTIRRGRNEFVFNNRVMMAPVGICATGGGADNGRINAFDTHENLLKTNAIYREINDSQVKGGGDFDQPA